MIYLNKFASNKNAAGICITKGWFPKFLLIWIGQAFSLFGSQIVSFSLVWWLTKSTGSASLLAASTLFTVLPGILLSPFTGTFVDRFDRKKVMILSDILVALLTVLLVLFFYFNIIQPWIIIAVMFLRQLAGTFQGPAMTATTTLMVPEDQLSRIGGMNSTLSGVLTIIAPMAGAMLIEALPIYFVLSIDIITAIIAIVLLFIIAIPEVSKEKNNDKAVEKTSFIKNYWEETKEGFRFVLKWRALLLIVLTCTAANFFAGPASSFTSLMVTQEFGGGVIELGYLNVAAGVGIILGGLLMSAWKGFKRRLITSAVGWLGVGVSYIIITFIPGNMFFLYILAMLFSGIMSPVGGAPQTAFYQSSIPADKQGRVFGVLGSIDGMTVPIGLLLGWILGDILPIRLWYFLLGISHAILGIVWLGVPFIRKAEDEAALMKESELNK